MLEASDWKQIRQLRRGPVQKADRLLDAAGMVVPSEERAQVLAHHFATAQWHRRPAPPLGGDSRLGTVLPVNLGHVTWEEVAAAARRLRTQRAAGVDDLPGEFWKLLLPPSQ